MKCSTTFLLGFIAQLNDHLSFFLPNRSLCFYSVYTWRYMDENFHFHHLSARSFISQELLAYGRSDRTKISIFGDLNTVYANTTMVMNRHSLFRFLWKFLLLCYALIAPAIEWSSSYSSHCSATSIIIRSDFLSCNSESGNDRRLPLKVMLQMDI